MEAFRKATKPHKSIVKVLTKARKSTAQAICRDMKGRACSYFDTMGRNILNGNIPLTDEERQYFYRKRQLLKKCCWNPTGKNPANQRRQIMKAKGHQLLRQLAKVANRYYQEGKPSKEIQKQVQEETSKPIRKETKAQKRKVNCEKETKQIEQHSQSKKIKNGERNTKETLCSGIKCDRQAGQSDGNNSSEGE